MAEMEDNTVMRQKFNRGIATLVATKRADNSAFMTVDEYRDRIHVVKIAKEVLQIKGAEKIVAEYQLVWKYSILTVDNEERLIRLVKDENIIVLNYMKNEYLYNVLHKTQLAVGHSGRHCMKNKLKKRYCNVIYKTILVYLKNCAFPV